MESLIIKTRKLNYIIRNELRLFDEITGVDSLFCAIVDYVHERKMQGYKTIQRDIEKEFLISKASATEVLNNLEKEEYLIREKDDIDSRKKNIVLTLKGEKLYKINKEKIEKIDEEIFKTLTNKEKEEFDKILSKVLGKYGG